MSVRPSGEGPAVYVDLDDVLANTTRQIVARLNRDFQRSVRFEDLSSFDLIECFSIDPARRAEVMQAVHEPEFLGALPERSGARSVLERWQVAGAHVSVVTGRPPSALGASRAWLAAREIPHHTLHCVDKYGRYAGDEGHIARDAIEPAAYAIAVEDSLDMACYLAQGGTELVLLMDRPWNRAVPKLPDRARARLRRVAGWREIAAVSREIEARWGRSRP